VTSGVARLSAVALAALLAAGCGATTYDQSIADEQAPQPSTTTTLPAGGATEVLPVLLREATSITQLMIDEGDSSAAAARVDALWRAVQDEVAATRPELLNDFDANVARLATAVRFKRAADADKAALNLRALVGSYLS